MVFKCGINVCAFSDSGYGSRISGFEDLGFRFWGLDFGVLYVCFRVLQRLRRGCRVKGFCGIEAGNIEGSMKVKKGVKEGFVWIYFCRLCICYIRCWFC